MNKFDELKKKWNDDVRVNFEMFIFDSSNAKINYNLIDKEFFGDIWRFKDDTSSFYKTMLSLIIITENGNLLSKEFSQNLREVIISSLDKILGDIYIDDLLVNFLKILNHPSRFPKITLQIVQNDSNLRKFKRFIFLGQDTLKELANFAKYLEHCIDEINDALIDDFIFREKYYSKYTNYQEELKEFLLCYIQNVLYTNPTVFRKEKREDIPESIRDKLLELYKHRCISCGDEVGKKKDIDMLYNIDHFFPFHSGGGNHFLNYVVLCRKCNLTKLDSERYFNTDIGKGIINKNIIDFIENTDIYKNFVEWIIFEGEKARRRSFIQ